MPAIPRRSIRCRDTITAKWGPLTVLVNGAGGNKPEATTIPPGGDFCKLPLDAWHAVFDLNLTHGTLLPCQIFGETMLKAGRGSVINIASISSILPLSRVVAYSAAKAAVLNLTQFLAREWATKGIRADQRDHAGLLPRRAESGDAPPPSTARTPSAARRSSATRRWAASARPASWPAAGRLARAPRASGFVTGQNIVVDGGFSSVTI